MQRGKAEYLFTKLFFCAILYHSSNMRSNTISISLRGTGNKCGIPEKGLFCGL